MTEEEFRRDLEVFEKECRLAGYVVNRARADYHGLIVDVDRDLQLTDWVLAQNYSGYLLVRTKEREEITCDSREELLDTLYECVKEW